MHRFIFFILLLATNCFTLYAQDKTNCNDWKKDALKGRIKNVLVEKVKVLERDGQVVETERRISTSKSYNENGYLTEELIYNSDGSEDSRLIYRYDDKNRIIETQIYNDNNPNPEKTLYIYNRNGKQTDMTDYNKDGSVKYKSSYVYDDKGNSIEEKYCYDGKSCTTVKQKYDEKGRIIELSTYESDGSLFVKKKFTYNEREEKQETLLESSPKYRPMLMTVLTISRSCDGSWWETCECNLNNTLRNSNEKSCECDKNGNWIKRVNPSQNTDTGLIEKITEYRTITYY